MRIDQLEAFLAVIKYRGFRPASEHLFLSQPTVSMRIRALEKELEVNLFIRRGRGTSLSRQGVLLVPYARRIIRTYRKAYVVLHTDDGANRLSN
ncbi:MAG: LysR family transcriptional regulator [Sporolactobacillus sp.]|jgi:DNA-binding transcriptional LysR family regulator|nr:LysR family transcriptional regulator [Sporolactobacillus sp.]